MKLVIGYQIDRRINENFFLNNHKLRAQFRFWNHPEYQFAGRNIDIYDI